MVARLSEADWANLLHRIADGNCTPFLGAGASASALPIASKVASTWAASYDYPLADSNDLARVAQFVAVKIDGMRPKEDFAKLCGRAAAPDFSLADSIHGLLAELPLSVYVTTNYDDF